MKNQLKTLKRASAPTADCESGCTVRIRKHSIRLIAPVNSDSDIHESQELGSVRRDAQSGTQDVSSAGRGGVEGCRGGVEEV
eukprot:2280647-Pyramimonas_sp.AAC.1